MKRTVLGIILALTIAAPVSARQGASITAVDGEYHFGQTYAIAAVIASYEAKKGKQPDGGYWARADCYANETTIGQPVPSVVYAQFQSLTSTVQSSGFTFGPTPSWSGGGADCTVRLAPIDNGVISYIATDTFTVLP